MNLKGIKVSWRPIGLLVFIVVVIVFVALGFSARSARAGYESDLNAQFERGVASLGNCETKITEALNIARESGDRFQKIVEIAAKAVTTYFQSGGNGIPAAGVTRTQMSTLLTPLLIQLYPNQNALLAAFKRVYDTAIGCRDDFFNEQSRTLELARVYQRWINGNWKPVFYGAVMDFPSGHLKFVVGGSIWRGQDALDKSLQPLTTAEAQDEYQKGKLRPVITSPTETAPTVTTTEGK